MAVTDNAGIGLAMNMGQLSLTRNYPQISSESKADQLYDQQQAALEERERHQKQQQQHLQQQYQQVQYEQPQQHQQGEQGQSQEQHQSQNQAHASSAPQKPGLSGGQGHGQGQHPQVVRSNRANGANGVNGHIKAENGSNGGDDEGHTLDARSNVSNDSMRELEDLLTKLNPLAKEFVPPSHADLASTTAPSSVASSKGQPRKVTEEQLAALFITCGQVVDCRVCGDPNSVLRFAFVEFTDEEGARAALSLAGTMLGYYPVRVLPSKTAIVPVNPTFLPRSEDEREMCARTIYCTNIDKKVSQADVKLFFESLCGEVARLRLLGDYHHSTRIAFVEFVMAESAMAALNCSGAILGSLPIRVSPSKTPVRPRSPRSPLH
ncbi:polyadenylate-binding protein-interacting protein 12 isoform X4 [Physcomitrium patens]|uniref:polyadenylate-binding protein-interacting protein 12 isoform X4 n=1 Tax=Physcomitrium patens TaxID=3218 RepID=UPI000D157401|nr:polyadenylate-binding protein-interacting protein 12-like isoform X4 [Physcomitrium patens]|eukprot:XP_024364567.1 polyadenylate-binding protein-interacting protein 12-like isoform X4 [Physcomitrella patens]